jgi:UDP-N-acetyl-D-mannosaminuronic acid dehydrogenase
VSLQAALDNANVIVILVDHKEFKEADKMQFAKKVVIDTRGVIS